MRSKKKIEVLGILVLAINCWSSVRAATVSGTVVDPQHFVIAGADVHLACGSQTEARITDSHGYFAFTRAAFPDDCLIRVTHPGFAVLEFMVGNRQVMTLELSLAKVKQTIAVKDELAPNSLATVSLSRDELHAISDNSDEQVKYAKELAGIQSASDHIYVDGLPTEHLPPANRIDRITINANPFSAEYSDASDTHIDIATRSGERKFRLSSGGVSLGPNVPDGLNSRLRSVSRTGSLGLTGPVPDLPIAFTSDVYFTNSRRETPIESVIPSVQGIAFPARTGAPVGDSNTLLSIGADYARDETLRMNASLYVGMAKHSNMNVSGLVLPEAGLHESATARELRVTFRKTGKVYIYRGGISTAWSNTDLNANSSGLGINVSGAFVAGGADYSKEAAQTTSWTLKNVFEFSAGKHYWSAGATISRLGNTQDQVPNSFGNVHFDDLSGYIMSATTGAQTGTWSITQGKGQAGYSSLRAAPFLETEVLRRAKLSLRTGLRADYQTAGSVLFSPRVSAVAALHRVVIRAGSGMFVENWNNSVFLRVIENDGHHLQQFLAANASLSDIKEGAAIAESKILSTLAPNLTPSRDWMCKFSVERPFERFVPGVEYTWTDGTHLLGSERLSTPSGWTDILESNRRLRKQQLHFRAQFNLGAQSVTAHYQLIQSRDNTDGPFSFPARQGDIRDEWAPSTGISRHNFTIAGNIRFGKQTSLTLVEVVRTPSPLNVISGFDLQRDGLYTDRGGRPRNSERGAGYNGLEMFAHRRIAIPKLIGPKQRIFLDLAVHGENLLGRKNYVDMGNVIGSPLLGRPLSALPGRSLHLSLNLAQ